MNDQGVVQILNNVMSGYMKEVAEQISLAQAILKSAQTLRVENLEKERSDEDG